MESIKFYQEHELKKLEKERGKSKQKEHRPPSGTIPLLCPYYILHLYAGTQGTVVISCMHVCIIKTRYTLSREENQLETSSLISVLHRSIVFNSTFSATG